MKYFKNRQNPLKEIQDDELDNIFLEIINTFGEEWLDSEGDHPIQILWKRKDFIATNELYTLGYSIQNLRKVNNTWVDNQITLILGNDKNNRRGAFFELIGLSFFMNPNNKVIPAKAYQCGYDGILELQNRARIYVSMKNYGISIKHGEFLTKAKNIECIAVRTIKEKRVRDISIIIDCPNRYPIDLDWDLLESKLPGIINSFENKPCIMIVQNTWYIVLHNLKEIGKEFHERYNSYTCIITSPYHKNEELNLYSKLDEACYGLSKHSIIEDDSSINIIFVHLPISGSVNNCMKWASEYFLNNSDKPISGIFFYKPEVVQDETGKTTFIHHCFNMQMNDKYNKWCLTNKINNINLCIPVGKVSSSPSLGQMVFSNGSIIDIDNRYIFQSGNHYLKSQLKENGSVVGDINKVASGIFTHCILKLPYWKEGEEVKISGRFAPSDELLIL